VVGVRPIDREILGAIILFITILVMHNLLWLKIAPKCLLHHKPVFSHIIMPIAGRMIGALYQHVAVLVDYPPAPPSPIALHYRLIWRIGDGMPFKIRLHMALVRANLARYLTQACALCCKSAHCISIPKDCIVTKPRAGYALLRQVLVYLMLRASY